MRSFRGLQPFIALLALMYSTASHAGVFVGVSVGFPPPLLPVYAQPICPGPDLLWTPGYWAYDPDVDDYYWVPGTWVRAPVVGYLWTPGYWGWSDGYYLWHAGYWGPHVGYYGGINYGFGYVGEGYHGGYWNHGAFVYNTAVTNVNTTIIHNTYNETVVVNRTTANNVSFNGGKGGVTAQPTAQEKLAASEQHTGLTQQQTEHEHGRAKTTSSGPLSITAIRRSLRRATRRCSQAKAWFRRRASRRARKLSAQRRTLHSRLRRRDRHIMISMTSGPTPSRMCPPTGIPKGQRAPTHWRILHSGSRRPERRTPSIPTMGPRHSLICRQEQSWARIDVRPPDPSGSTTIKNRRKSSIRYCGLHPCSARASLTRLLRFSAT